MSPAIRHPFRPDYAIPPGVTLRDRLEEIDVSQADLAARSGFSTKHINQMLQGIAPITHETALILERVTGRPAAFWNTLEANYREALLRAKQRAISPEDDKWLRSIPTKALQERGVLPTGVTRGQLFEATLDLFGVADRAAWDRLWSRPVASFKRTKAFKSHPGAVAAWLRLGQLEARKVETTADYSASAFRKALKAIRTLTRDLDSDRLVEICAAAGVAVVFVREIEGSRISGATWWATPTRAVIALSDRYKMDDSFWFSFFHEAAHVLLHSKKATFIDDGSDSDELEDEANKFAAETLIPPELARLLPTLSTTADVKQFAKRLGIAPGIVVGRLHYDGLWEWRKGNDLRRHIHIVDVED